MVILSIHTYISWCQKGSVFALAMISMNTLSVERPLWHEMQMLEFLKPGNWTWILVFPAVMML